LQKNVLISSLAISSVLEKSAGGGYEKLASLARDNDFDGVATILTAMSKSEYAHHTMCKKALNMLKEK